MTFIFRNKTIFWDISKWNRGQKKWNGMSILISPTCEFHGRNKFDHDTKDMQLEASFMSSLKMYFWIFPPDINNIVLWRERERERERDLDSTAALRENY